MRKFRKILLISFVLFSLFILGGVWADHYALQENLIRLHVVANSDSAYDQDNKLVVRDAVISFLQENTADITTVSDAKVYLENSLQEIENIVNQTLKRIDAPYFGKVSFQKEQFPMREYDTFSLPSGIYQSLRIELGNGTGKNWWCVTFPSLCVPKTTEDFRTTAIEAGFQDNLVGAISGDTYEIRFFLLDCFGKIKNFLYFG